MAIAINTITMCKKKKHILYLFGYDVYYTTTYEKKHILYLFGDDGYCRLRYLLLYYTNT